MTPAVFFDRDGIVNVRRPDDYVTSWEEFDFMPGVPDALVAVHALGLCAIIVTNQRGIAIGRMTEADLEEIHTLMQHALYDACGEAFDDILFCPHDRTDGCPCRKPAPGMLLRAADKWDVDLAASWMIGDSESDILAGKGAGCRTILVGAATDTAADHRCASLVDAVAIIVAACGGFPESE